MVCEGLTGRLEVAQELLDMFGLENVVKITEVNSGFFAKEYFAARPLSERLINKRLDDANLNIMRDWRVALREYIRNYYDGYLVDRSKISIIGQV